MTQKSEGGFLSKLKLLDAYPKINEDFFTRTASGGIVTIVASIFMLTLFLSEFRLFLQVKTNHELNVDTSRGETIAIHVNVTFPHIPCSVLSLDAMDVSGDAHLDVIHNVFKRRLDPDGSPHADPPTKADVGHDGSVLVKPHENGTLIDVHKNETYCGSCYGAEEFAGECCNTCDQVRERYRQRGWAFSNMEVLEQCKREGYVDKMAQQKGEGCNVYGQLEVNKVAGNFHFAPGKSFQQGNMHVHDLMQLLSLYGQDYVFNMTHRIERLSFGADFPGQINPLNGVRRVQTQKGAMYQYFVKVVPTVYQDIRETVLKTNQFSVTEHMKDVDLATGKNLPGVFFFYDINPIQVHFTEEKSTFTHFLTSVCAIVGGVFTVSGIVDSFVYHGGKALKKKMELGKLN